MSRRCLMVRGCLLGAPPPHSILPHSSSILDTVLTTYEAVAVVVGLHCSLQLAAKLVSRHVRWAGAGPPV
jgi:hypothetical protein